jgi:hypothetical protein
MFRNTNGNADLKSQTGESPNPETCSFSRQQFYRMALVSFLVIIVMGAVIGTAVGLLVH